MDDSHSTVTSISLLAQIRHDDRSPSAWRAFVDRYGPRIYEWCLNRRLQPADAEDVTQEVLLKLARRLGEFEYDPKQSFRGWLRRVTENAIIDFFRDQKEKKNNALGGEGFLEIAEDRQDLAKRLEGAFDLELLDLAKRRVRSRIDKNRWKAWEMMAVDQMSAKDVSGHLEMKIPTVYSSRFQVQKMIADEVRVLEEESNSHVRETTWSQ